MIRDYHALVLPKKGELVCGDAAIVRQEGNRALVALIDGLGHGPRAAEAADRARQTLEQIELIDSVVPAMRTLHDALAETRGAAAFVCMLRDQKLWGCSVGNIEFRSHRMNASPLCSAGVVGHRMPRVREFTAELNEGGRFALLTDGISSSARLDIVSHLPVQEASETLFERHRKDDDAGIVMVDL